MSFATPVDSLLFALDDIADLAADCAKGLHPGFASTDAAGILEEGARFANATLAPLNRIGDRIGARLEAGVVTTAPGWKEAYREWSEAGWNGVDLPAAFGGMALPTRLGAAAMEMWTSACMAFGLGPVLTQGAVDALNAHASEALKAIWLPKLVSGEWMATMNLTESAAGSDLGLLRTRATRVADGSYRIVGAKIFITYGEHDLTQNIVHLVLARLPDSPPGTRGLSLFLVPKFLLAADGSLGPRNDLDCTGLEHKLGIHASPTCAMSYGDRGGAIGWLVGEENRGLACMFTMMNKARLFTGLQGVAIGERAYQQALAYAKTRRQGRVAGAPGGEPSLIVEHADVRRNLMRMKSLVWAGRALAYSAAAAIDRSHASAESGARERADELAGLLTPIVKAMCSDFGVEVASIGVQVHGGAGYVEETGAAQHLRDARITPIYEGTNGIQAIDLVTRKALRPGSDLTTSLIAEYRAIGDEAAATRYANLAACGAVVGETADALARSTAWLAQPSRTVDEKLAIASPYLRLFGLAAASALLAKGAVIAARRIAAGDEKSVDRDAVAIAAFFASNFAIEALGLERIVVDSAPMPVALSDFAA